MKRRMLLLLSAIAATNPMAAVHTATAQGMQDRMGSGMMRGGADQQPMDHRMMQGGMGRGMMCPMMQSGTMQGGVMGREMMGSGMMGGGMGALFGSRVTLVMNLSVDDVRGYLASQLERLNSKRLKVGDINSGDGTIIADIVTVTTRSCND